jgi:predicted nucleotide-binding protein
VNRRWHARHARLLIAACGDLDECATACRVRKTQLSDYQSPQGEGFMPADVIADLERHCGQPIYSGAIASANAEALLAKNLRDEACEAAEAAADLQRRIRIASSDDKISSAEREDLARAWSTTMSELRQVGQLLDLQDPTGGKA